jgi:hypothetical protein
MISINVENLISKLNFIIEILDLPGLDLAGMTSAPSRCD